MIKYCQATCAIKGLPFMGNPKHVVIHDLNRTLANYNQASFNMAKNDMKQVCKSYRIDNDYQFRIILN